MSLDNIESLWGERAFEELVENASDVIARFDRAYRHLYVNRAVTRATGLAAADFVGRTHRELGMPAPMVQAWEAALQRVFGAPHEETIEFSYVAPDGASRWYECRLVPELSAGGTVDTVLAIGRDITAARAAEEAKLERVERDAAAAHLQRDLLASAIHHADVCVAIMTGPELRYTLVNPAYERIAPGTPMHGRSFREVFPDAADAGAEAHFRRVLETGEPWRIERYNAPVPADPGATWDGEAIRLPVRAGEPRSIVVFVRNITDRMRIEEALERSEQALRTANRKLEQTLDSMTDGTLVFDREWRYVLVSERAAAIIGIPRQTLIGGCVWDLFPRTRGTKFYEGYHRAMETQQPVHFEEYYPEPLNQWLECHCYPSPDQLTVYFRDVTDRRRAEEALRTSTALLRAISDSSPDVIFAKDRDGRIRFANPATLALIGKTFDEVAGRTDAEFLEDKDAARRVMENDRRIMESGQPAEVEEIVPMPDGAKRVWLSRKTPYRDDSGAVVGLLGISHDITRRKQDEEAVRSAHEALQRILNSITDGLAVLDRDWRYTYLSETGAKMLQLRREDVIGGRLWDLFPYAADSIFGQQYRLAVDTGLPTHFEAFYPPPLNVWLECHCYPSAEGLSVYFRDITERKKIEAERAALLETEKRLRAEAEQATEAKDRLLAAVSHELRNPLTAISGWLQVLEGELDAEMRALAFRSMRSSVASQKRMVDDLLDAVRLSRGSVPLVLAEVDLQDLVHEVAATMNPVATESGIDLNVNAAAVTVTGDRSRLMQVVANLVSNALKFTPEGGTITVSVERREDQAVIAVTDTGHGIAPEFLPRVFEKFSQARTHSTEGLGLGLAIVRDLVQQHGGTISAHSDGIGKGARFTVTLPIR